MIRHRAAITLISLLLVLPVVVLATTITYQYDNLGRLKSATQDNGNQTGYTYDAAGNRQAGTSFAPGTVQFASTSYSVNENAGSVSISISRVGGSSGAASVHYQTSDGTAHSGTNYTAASGTISWAAGDAATKTVTVTILDDHTYDANSAFNIGLSSATGANLGTQISASVTITNTDPQQPGTLSLSPATYSVLEANTSVTVTVTRTGGSDGPVSVQYATTGGTATAGSDYTSASGTLNWASGDGSPKSFSVPILDDSSGEATETIGVTLSNAGGSPAPSLGTASGTINIVDNEPGALAFTASTASVAEAGGTITVSVSRTNGSHGSVSVNYSAANGTATSGSDFSPASGTLTWADGDASSKNISVTILNDTLYEGNETFPISLSSPTGGATLALPTTVTVTIVDDDGPGVPTGLGTSPVGTSLGGGFTVFWSAASGTVNHYTLSEYNENAAVTTTYAVAVPTVSKVFTKSAVENFYQYKVRACSTTDDSVCSAYSGTVTIGTCPARGCQ